MGELFNRRAAVALTHDGASTIVRDLRVAFNVIQTLDPEPNEANVEIYGMSEASRVALPEDGVRLTLDVGYGDDLARLFAGDVIFSSTRFEAPEVVTEIQVQDGVRGRRAKIAKTLRRGAPARRALQELLAAMGITAPADVLARPELARPYLAGMTLTGDAGDQVTKLMRRVGLEWTVVDGELLVLSSTETRGEAVVISQDTGMIGSPSVGPPDKKGGPKVISAKTLVDPRVRPGGLVMIRSRTVEGLHKVVRCEHAGDTHADPWYTTIEANPR
jgi:hypothetical protein